MLNLQLKVIRHQNSFTEREDESSLVMLISLNLFGLNIYKPLRKEVQRGLQKLDQRILSRGRFLYVKV